MMTSLSREDGCSNKGASQFQACGRTTPNPPGRWEIFQLIWGPERFGQYRSRRDRSLPGGTDHADIAIFAFLAFRTTVVIAAAVLELSDRVEVVAADANNPADLLRRQNPLGKISCANSRRRPGGVRQQRDRRISRRARERRQDHPRRRRTLRGVDSAVARRRGQGRGNSATLPAALFYKQRFRAPEFSSSGWDRTSGASKADDATRGWRRRADAKKPGGESAGFVLFEAERLRTCSSDRRGISKCRGRCWSRPAFPRSRSWIASAQRDTRL
jgi:hypothetical protein